MISSRTIRSLSIGAILFATVVPAVADDSDERRTGGPTVIRQKNIPYTITKPGAYVLGSNLVVADPNVTAIFIASDDVTVDLAGFSIQGPNVGGGHAAGIDSDPHHNVLVRNGSVRGFHSPSLGCVHLPGFNNTVESVRVENCSIQGIFVGIAGRIERCQVSSAVGGISADHGSILTGNTLFDISNIAIGAGGDGGVLVVGNNCRESATCIRVGTDGNRIESNVVTESGVALDLTGGADNYFARNFLKGNASAVLGAADDVDGGTVDPALSNVIIP